MKYYFYHGFIHRASQVLPFGGLWEAEKKMTPAMVFALIREEAATRFAVDISAIELDRFERVE